MVDIRETDLITALSVLENLPEFSPLKERQYYEQTVTDKPYLALCAYEGETAVACKIGYDKFEDGSFYSWLGGVNPNHRKKGLAKALADRQEQWAVENGFTSIKFKTLNRLKAMLQFALSNGFSIYNVKPREELAEYRIELIKPLI